MASEGASAAPTWLEIVEGETLAVLGELEGGTFELVYVDPPFNTGRRRRLQRLRTERNEDGDRVGFGGRRYRTEVVSEQSYDDSRWITEGKA